MGAGGAVRTAYWVSSGRAARARAQQQALGLIFRPGKLLIFPALGSLHQYTSTETVAAATAQGHAHIHAFIQKAPNTYLAHGAAAALHY